MIGEFESLAEKWHVQAKVDLVDQITYALSMKANLLRRDVDRNEHPSPQVVDEMIEKVRRLQIALEGCKVGEPERSSSS